MFVRIHEIVDDRLCYEKVRELRWAEGVKCPHCGSMAYRRHGHHNSTEHRLRYQCKACERYYNDLTKTIFEGHHQPLKVWILSHGRPRPLHDEPKSLKCPDCP